MTKGNILKYKGELKISDLDEYGNFEIIKCNICNNHFTSSSLAKHLSHCGKKYNINKDD